MHGLATQPECLIGIQIPLLTDFADKACSLDGGRSYPWRERTAALPGRARKETYAVSNIAAIPDPAIRCRLSGNGRMVAILRDEGAKRT